MSKPARKPRTKRPATQKPAVKAVADVTTEEVASVEEVTPVKKAPAKKRTRRTRAQIEAESGATTPTPADKPKSGKLTPDEAIVALGKNLKEQTALQTQFDKVTASHLKDFEKEMGALVKEYEKVKNFL